MRIGIALLIALALAAPVAAEQTRDDRRSELEAPATPVAVQKVFKFSRCVAQRYPSRAANVLALDYRTPQYRDALYKLSQNNGLCVGLGRLHFSRVLMAGGMAETLLERDGVQTLGARISGEAIVTARDDIRLGIVAPDGRDGMIQHAAQFAAAGIPFIFDPGQGLPMFGGEELKAFIAQATWVAVNDYEWQVLQQKTGWSAQELLQHVDALIVTRGAEGSTIYAAGRELHIPCARPTAVVDPTGCGDAYRAGIIHGLMHGLDWETTGRIASLLGAIKIESRGTQNHRFTLAEFEQRYRESFGTDCGPRNTPLNHRHSS